MKRFLEIVERAGNALPNPATLFALLAVIIIVMSGVATYLDVSVQHPVTGATISPINLLSLEGLHRILTSLVTNFTNFAPLGNVVVTIIGIGVAESAGLIAAAMRKLVLSSPRRLMTPIIVFAGVMSNIASDIGYVLLIPLAGIVFHAIGRHPLVGVAAAFASVSGGYTANLLLGTVDPLLAGLSQEAARLVDPTYRVTAVGNWFFMAASTPVIVLLGWWVTERFVASRFPDRAGLAAPEEGGVSRLSAEERRGLRFAGWAGMLITLLVFLAALPPSIVPGAGFLRDPRTGDLLDSPLIDGVVALIFVYGLTMGLAFGIGARTIRNDTDVVTGMTNSVRTLSSYLVLVFFAAQFVAFFNWTQLGLILAVNGAEALRSLELSAIPLLLSFVVLSAGLNLVFGSASAKWALMAPVFVPMLMLLGYSPELTQTAYRIGDSVTNVITPMISYFALVIAYFQKYESKAGLGTIVAVMLPYSVAFMIGWCALLALWIFLGIPLGPGAPLMYPARGG